MTSDPLFLALLAGSGRGATSVFNDILPATRRIVRSKVRGVSEDDLDDAIQVVVERLIKRDPNENPVANLRAFLIKATRNRLIDQIRSRARSKTVAFDDLLNIPGDDEVPEYEIWLPSSSWGGPNESMYEDPAAQLPPVDEMLEPLKGRQAQLMRLMFLEGMTLKQAAKALNITENNAHQIKHRAIKALRAKLAGM